MSNCTNKEQNFNNEVNILLRQIQDSSVDKQILAVYQDVEDYAVLLNDSTKNIILKINCTQKYRLITDTLKKLGFNLYHSVKSNTDYEIQNQKVKLTIKQKIIHPSSNWQGQTPWQEILSVTCDRLDLKKNKSN